VAISGGNSVSLPAGRTIPAKGNCTISVDVTAALPGSYLNTLGVGALVTNNGNSVLPATAPLTVLTIAAPPVSVPTVSVMGLLVLIGAVFVIGFLSLRLRRG
jgi:hypothetical protein